MLASFVLAAAALADPCVDYRQYVHTTTTFALQGATDVATAPGWAYVAYAGDLAVLDVSQPDWPVLRGQVALGGANSVASAGGHVLVTNGGLQVVDVSDPSSPVIVGSVNGIGATKVVTMGNVAFVAGSVGASVVDLSVPSAPQVLTTIPSTYQGTPIQWPMRDVAVVGNRLYAVSAELAVYDVTAPASPVLLGTYFRGPIPTQLAIVGSVAYVGYGGGTTDVVNVADPAAMALVASLSLGRWEDLVVSGNLAFVGFSDNRLPLRVYDVSDPLAPRWIGAAAVPSGHREIALSGDRLFAAGGIAPYGGSGVSVVDIQPPFSPPTARVDTPGDARAVVLAGTHAYVADGTSLQVVDVSDRFAPILVGSLAVEASVVAVDGNLVIVAGGGTTRLADVTDPAAPILLGSLPGGAQDLELVGTRAYRADGNLDIIDVSNPAAPVLLGSSTTSALQVEVDGSYAYTVNGFEGGDLSVLDISGDTPVLSGSVTRIGYCASFSVKAPDAYCADPTHGYIWVYDVGNPAAPAQDDYDINAVNAIAISTPGGLYAAQGTDEDEGGLRIIPEITGAQYPQGFFAVSPQVFPPTSIAVGGGLVLVPAGTSGLYVLPDHCEPTTSVADEVAKRSLLLEAWPRPARGPLSLRFALSRADPVVRFRVYDVAGRLRRNLGPTSYPAGVHFVAWDGRDEQGREVGSGVYQVLLTTSAGTTTTRVVMVR